jgi:hypothetical protein
MLVSNKIKVHLMAFMNYFTGDGGEEEGRDD